MPEVPRFDGLKMIVQYYANWGKLEQVSELSGVPVAKLKAWLATGTITTEDYDSLTTCLHRNHFGDKTT